MEPTEAASGSLRARLRRFADAVAEPHPALRGAEARRRARLLSALLAATIPLSVTATLLSPALAGTAGPLLAEPIVQQGLATCACGFVAYALSRTRHTLAASLLTLALAEVGTWSAVALSAGTPHGASAPYFLGINVILAALLLPPAWTFGLAAVNIAAVLALPRLAGFDAFTAVNAALLLGFISAFLAIFAAVRRRDLRHIEAQAHVLAEREERLRAIVTNAPDIILMVDRAGTIRYINRTVPGLTPEGVVGTDLGDHVEDADAAVLRERLARVFATGQPEAFEVEGQGPWGAKAWYASRLGPIFQDGQVVAATLITTDVTDLKEAEEERARGRERVLELARMREAERFRSTFLNLAAHELRTPMTPIKTQLYVLRRRRAAGWDAEERRAFELLERNVERLAALQRDVLDAARLDDGRVDLRLGSLDLAEAAAEALERHRAAAQAAGVALHAALDEALPVRGDALRLQQVLAALLANALRFTPAGGAVHVEACREGDQAVLRVRDTGLGMTPVQLATLFEPFTQMRFGADHSSEGTGLGLYIGQRVAEAHGGRLQCTSEGPGKGCTFSLALPVAPATAAALPLAATPRETAAVFK